MSESPQALPSEPASASTPADIDIVRDRSVTITFEDGVVCEFAVDVLRAACPCATCRGLRERGEDAWPRPGGSGVIEVRDAQLSGAWGLSIDWSDGHSTGIYAWAALRRWWDAGLDEPLVIDPVPTAAGATEMTTHGAMGSDEAGAGALIAAENGEGAPTVDGVDR